MATIDYAAQIGGAHDLWCNAGATAMGWDRKKRGSKQGYYYRSRRVGGRTVKEYVGTGPLAATAAELDEDERRQRQAAKEAWAAEQVRLAAADAAFHDLRAAANLLTTSTLLAAGFHQHRGQWRRRRWHGRPNDDLAG